MVEHLVIDGASLEAAKNDIARARGDFGTEQVFCDQVADSVGHKDLGDSLRKFASDWSVKRSKLSQKLEDLQAKLDASIKAFGDWDDSAAKANTVQTGAQNSGPAQGGPAPTPAPQQPSPSAGGSSGGNAGTSPAPLPPVPSIAGTDEATSTATATAHASATAYAGLTPGGTSGSALPHAPDGDPPATQAITDVVVRLERAVDGWESLPTAEQALLFSSIGIAGLTLLVRSGKLPASVLTPVTPSTPAVPGGTQAGPTTSAFAGSGSSDQSELATSPELTGDTTTTASVDAVVGESVDGSQTLPDDATVDVDAVSTEPDTASDPAGSTPSAAGASAEPAVDTEAMTTTDLPAVPSIDASDASDPSDDPVGAGGALGPALSSGTGSGGGSSHQSEALPPVPPLSELLAPAAQGAAVGVAAAGGQSLLPPLREVVAPGAATTTSGPASQERSMGLAAGHGMASLSSALGGTPGGTGAAVPKNVQEGKVREAVKALADLRSDDAKETRK